jgi:hypothetical protein
VAEVTQRRRAVIPPGGAGRVAISVTTITVPVHPID